MRDFNFFNKHQADKRVPIDNSIYSSLVRRQQYRMIYLVVPCLVFLTILFAYPIIRLTWLSLFIPDFSPKNYIKIFEASVYYKVLLTSLKIAFNCTVLCLILGYPVAYLLNNVSTRTRNILFIGIIVPYFLSLLVRIYGWYMILGRKGVINYFLVSFGFTDQPLKLLFNNIGVHVGMVNMLLPYMILALFGVMRGIDKDLLKASQNLGATPTKTFLHVFLPLSLPGIAAGSMLVFILGVGYFVIPALMGGRKEIMIAQLIRTTVSELMNWEFGAALALFLLVTTCIFILIFNHYLGLDRIWGGEGKESTKQIGKSKEEIAKTNKFYLINKIFKISNSIIYHYFQKIQTSISNSILIKDSKIYLHKINSILRAYSFISSDSLREYSSAYLIRPCFYLLCGISLLFLMAPIFVIIPMSFSSAKYLTFPPPGFSLQWYVNYFTSERWISATIMSFRVAGTTALIASLLGLPASISLVRGRFKGKEPLNIFFMFPIIIPSIIIAIAIYFIFSELHLVGTSLAISIGHSIITIPLIITIFSANLKGFDETLEKASRSLGAGPVRTFLSITLPILAPGAISGAFVAFMRSFDEVVIALFMCGPATRTLPIRMWEGIREEVDPTITAVSSLLIAFVLLILFTTGLLMRRGEKIKAKIT